jgi:hypothetical protein
MLFNAVSKGKPYWTQEDLESIICPHDFHFAKCLRERGPRKPKPGHPFKPGFSRLTMESLSRLMLLWLETEISIERQNHRCA